MRYLIFVLCLFCASPAVAQPQFIERNIARSKATLSIAIAEPGWKNGELVSTQGHTTAGDAGGAEYIYRSTGRSGLAVGLANSPLYPNGSRADDYLELKDKTTISVRSGGVFPDGSDCSTELQALLDACDAEATATGDPVEVFFPGGTYVIASPITIPNTVSLSAAQADLSYTGTRNESTDVAALIFEGSMSGKTHFLPSVVCQFDATMPLAEDQFAAIKVQSATDSYFYLKSFGYCGVGLLLAPAAGSAVVHCNFYNGSAVLCRTAVELRGNTSTGYVNENSFWGLNIQASSSSASWGTVVGVKFSTATGGYKGQNNNRFYNPSFQVRDAATAYEIDVGSSVALNRRYWNEDNNREYICTNAGSGTVATVPTHTTGAQSDANSVEFTYVGHYFRSPVYHENGCGGYNQFVGSRWETGYGPFAMIDSASASWTLGNDYHTYTNDDNSRALPAINEFTTADSNQSRTLDANAYRTYTSPQSEHIEIGEIHKKIIQGAGGTTLKGFSWATLTTNVVSPFNVSGDITLLKNAVVISGSSRFPGVFVDTTQMQKVYFEKFTPYLATGRLYTKPATEDFELVNITNTTDTFLISSSTRNATYNAFRTGTDAGATTVVSDRTYPYVFCALDVAGVEVSEIRLVGYATGFRTGLTIADRYQTAHRNRYSLDTPSKGYFEVAGEIIDNASYSSGSPRGWIVQTAGILAPDWASGVIVRAGELRQADSGKIYAAQAAGMTGATSPTGTGSDINDDSVLWDYVATEAVLTPLSDYGHAQISIEDNATATTVASTQSDWSAKSQFTLFGTNFADSINATPDHTNDHITLTSAGTWEVSCVVTLSGSVVSDLWELALWKNNGATQVSTKQGVNIRGAGLTYEKQVTISGLVDASANDTIELWVQRTNGTGSITITNAVMTAKKVSD